MPVSVLVTLEQLLLQDHNAVAAAVVFENWREVVGQARLKNWHYQNCGKSKQTQLSLFVNKHICFDEWMIICGVHMPVYWLGLCLRCLNLMLSRWLVLWMWNVPLLLVSCLLWFSGLVDRPAHLGLNLFHHSSDRLDVGFQLLGYAHQLT